MKEKKEKKNNFWKPGEKKPQSGEPAAKPFKSPLNKSHTNNNHRRNEEKQDMSIISRHSTKSPTADTVKPTLSSSVMTMKFMTKKTEATSQDDKKRPHAATVPSSTASPIPEVAVSEENIASLPGRRSFRGFNAVVERHYNTVMNNQRYDSKLATISDEDMVQRYDELVGLPRGPNQGKAAKKPKFA